MASWSRIQGMGIPLWKAVEVLLIWAVAVVLAVPEAIAFDMVELSYWEQHLWVCMLASEQKSQFMRVCTPKQPKTTPIPTPTPSLLHEDTGPKTTPITTPNPIAVLAGTNPKPKTKPNPNPDPAS